MSWNIKVDKNFNAEEVLSQYLLRKYRVIEIKKDTNSILRSCGIDTV